MKLKRGVAARTGSRLQNAGRNSYEWFTGYPQHLDELLSV